MIQGRFHMMLVALSLYKMGLGLGLRLTSLMVIKLVFQDLKQELPDDYVANFFRNHDVLDDTMTESLKIFKLNNLSLQQAVNLAALLMRIERDLQSFTENIPTVGGVIKMAVIDKDGFRMILGDEIETPSI